jgi:hypothetical protein
MSPNPRSASGGRKAAALARAGFPVAGLAALAVAGSGCLGEPPIEERWTLLEITSGPSAATVVPGQPTAIDLGTRLTYRELLTGAVVAEVRASNLLTPADVDFSTEDALARTQMVDYVLRNSSSLGFATRLTTGFDHLIQEFSMTIDAAGTVPPMPDGFVADSLNVAGPGTTLFLLVYYGQVDEVEIEGGDEIEVVTPFFSDQYDILATGVVLTNGSP